MRVLSISILCCSIMALTNACCVFNLDSVNAEPALAIGGACLTDNENGSPLMSFQIGSYLVLDAQACQFLGDAILSTGAFVSGKGIQEETEFMETGDGIEPINYTLESTLRTTYLDIPVIASMPITDNLSAYAGPQASFLLGAKRTSEVNGQSSETQKGTDGLNGLDLGFTLGLRYELNNGIQLGVGWDQGLSNVYKSDYGASKSKNQVFKATVGLNINKFKNP